MSYLVPNSPKVLTWNWRCMTSVSLSNNYSPKELYILGDLSWESSLPTELPSHYVHLVDLQVTVILDTSFWWILKSSCRLTWVQQSIRFWCISSFRDHSAFTNFVSLQEGVLSTRSPKIIFDFFFSSRELKIMGILLYLWTSLPLKKSWWLCFIFNIYLFIYHIDFIILYGVSGFW